MEMSEFIKILKRQILQVPDQLNLSNLQGLVGQ